MAKDAMKLVPDGTDEKQLEAIAKAVAEVSDAATKLLAGPLTNRALVTLIRDITGPSITRTQINQVLEAAAALKETFVK
jgi:hypothetical protein